MTTTNKAGIKPLEYNVLIKPDEVGEKMGSVFIPDDVRDKEQVASTTGTVIALSPAAFTYEEDMPTVEEGDRVVFARYAGMKVDGTDGKDYLMVKDKSICGILVDQGAGR